VKDFARITQTKFQSNMDVIHLHALLNDELEKFHKLLNKMKKLSLIDMLALEPERAANIQTINHINERIQSLIKAKRKSYSNWTH